MSGQMTTSENKARRYNLQARRRLSRKIRKKYGNDAANKQTKATTQMMSDAYDEAIVWLRAHLRQEGSALSVPDGIFNHEAKYINGFYKRIDSGGIHIGNRYDWFKAVEYGTPPGTIVPIEPLMEWAYKKVLRGYTGPGYKKRAYLIARAARANIYADGVAPAGYVPLLFARIKIITASMLAKAR